MGVKAVFPGASQVVHNEARRVTRAREQGVGVMFKAVYAVIAAAFIAGCFVSFLSLAQQVEARGSVAGAKADRADARSLGIECSRRAWPYFEASCLRDARNPYGQAHEVRLISAERATLGSSKR